MPEYRRARLEGGTFFFTLVTWRRRPILTTPAGLRSFRHAWHRTRRRFPFRTWAACLLPDHFHCIWELPGGDEDYSIRWRALKGWFSRHYLAHGGRPGRRNASRRARGEAAIWQRRFWEHAIRDERDLRSHIDYVHYNPVRHGYVSRPADWRWSSFGRFVREGWYDLRWGESESAEPELAHSSGE